MIDLFSISHTSGIVLYSSAPAATPINTFIAHIQSLGNTLASNSQIGAHKYEWLMASEFGLIFLIAYPRILNLTYVAALLARLKSEFIQRYSAAIQEIVSLTALGTSSKFASPLFLNTQGWSDAFPGWNKLYNDILRHYQNEVDITGRKVSSLASTISPNPDTPSESEIEEKEVLDSETIARNMAALRARGRGGKALRGAARRKVTPSSTDTESGPKSKKEQRKWGDALADSDASAYDFSDSKESSAQIELSIDRSSLGSTDKSGLYNVATYSSSSAATQGASLFTKLKSRFGYQSKPVTEAELAPLLASLTSHLQSKNVARACVDGIITRLRADLLDKPLGSSNLQDAVSSSLSDALTRILTPQTSTDLLHSIAQKKRTRTSLLNSTPDPYILTFIGVNGVGKSTNLSKVCFWLLQNRLNVLIAACDTFRSGAVEQLRVHVRNLSGLAEADETKGRVELFERGYGKDAAGIAKEAIAYGKEKGFDVVLVDTAGRMQDNEPLMRALGKLVQVNSPDKIVFVGEAVVGNESVDQLSKFDIALKTFSATPARPGRGIDGLILTKMDVIDDKVWEFVLVEVRLIGKGGSGA